MDKPTYDPVRDYLMVSPETLPEKIGSIVTPEAYRFTLGEGPILKKGPDCSPDFNVGDTVVFRPGTDYKFDLDGKTICLVKETDVILKLVKKD